MGVSNIPYPLDIMNLMANVHNKKCVEQLTKQIKDSDEKIGELEGRIAELEKLLRA